MTINEQTLKEQQRLREQLDQLIDLEAAGVEQEWRARWAAVAAVWASVAVLAAVELGDSSGRRSGDSPPRSPGRRRIRANARLKEQVDATVAAAAEVAGLSAGRSVEGLAGAMRLAAQGRRSVVLSQLPRGVAVPWVEQDPVALARLAERLSGRFAGLQAAIPARLRPRVWRVLEREFSRGRHPTEAARRLVRDLGRSWDLSMAEALTITRTEFLDAHRAASQVADLANGSVLSGWQWLAELSTETCASCVVMHGTVHPLSEPGPLDHQNGRCARVPVLRPLDELGLVGLPVPEPLWQDSRAWFDALPVADQERVLGKARLALLRSGSVSWSDLAVRRSTPGWRDSFAPRSVRDLQAIAGVGKARNSAVRTRFTRPSLRGGAR